MIHICCCYLLFFAVVVFWDLSVITIYNQKISFSVIYCKKRLQSADQQAAVSLDCECRSQSDLLAMESQEERRKRIVIR